ncbi:Glu/Leu/Phe/Val family dehydrogenase [Pseudothermotoga thermarum]|uniref:Glutamate dehydrogenase n=1 Tax=Pseudothermotoga thermarum DSM 5069 TaxID=688269 RepID=F7YXA4_9THEM|nr:Glu/Leu/Phe/Val dehydrogenase [Pseudothermotoga thermarum]AEH51407.1 glutamate dehydrogenase (NAD/NADP) [Pseudothermotoga thermarum DSM 5069]
MEATLREEERSLYQQALKVFYRAAYVMELDPEIAKILAVPERSLTVRFPVVMDDGRIEVFTGYRCQHSTILGPAKGGVRYHPDVTLDEVETLAFWMTWKCSLMNLPYGGGKGGVKVDTTKLSPREFERLSRRFFYEISDIVGQFRDIPAPDVRTNSQVMAWFVDTYNKTMRRYEPGVVTGKPVEIGGSLGRDEATGRGLAVVTAEACEYLGIDISKATVAVQGFGNVGYFSAKILQQEYGAKVVAISASTAALYNPNGIDVEDLMNYKMQNKGSLVGYPKAQQISHKELLELNVDILVPAALENAITEENADNVKAKIIAEGANGPVTPEADKILNSKGILVIPDILANGGGVTVSYFEWVQNVQCIRWELEEVRNKLAKNMKAAFAEVVKAKQKYGTDLRTASYIVAIGRVATALKLKGIYP